MVSPIRVPACAPGAAAATCSLIGIHTLRQIHLQTTITAAFKAAAVGGDGGYVLPSWNASSTGGFCSWEGVTCQGQPRRVVALSLPSRGLNGVLSPAVGNLSSLTVLDLGSNRLSSAVPASLGRLRRLETLNLSSNAFSGEIPANLSSCTSLTSIGLQSNQLRGRLPPELGDKLTRLKILRLWKNNLTGAIPASLANLSSLSYMCPSYSTSSRAPSLLASAASQASGTLTSPSTASPLQGNMLHGEIPDDIGSSFPSLWVTSVASNQFTSSIPESLSNLNALKLLDFTDNRFSGHVPPTLGRLPALQRLLLAINRLQADDRGAYRLQTGMFDGREYRWGGTTARWANASRNSTDGGIIKFVTSPNNPDAMLRDPALRGSPAAIFNHAY
ncbi:putative LRR receptor-like serine/threonine-protein kinase [Panicum miliaceum]|uniref:LRR receptor-like serine/threonine-protein kinase n=1 Tax=Panicum miliaceum TaxID=4540 RepID=A0A3L6QD22_PANMI|nr:putative LRR receptor-like serine/threonine-protein kinase [Panicum miliaceum]